MAERKKKRFRVTKAYRRKVITYKIATTIFLVVFMLLGILNIFTHKKDYRLTGVDYYNSGDYEKAIEYFDKALDCNQWFSDNMDVDVLMYKSSAYLRLKDSNNAKKTYDRILADYSDKYYDKEQITFLSKICAALNMYGDGNIIDSMSDICSAVDNGYTELAMYAAEGYEQLNDYANMKKYLDIYQMSCPTDAYLCYKYVSYYLYVSDYAQAVSYAEQGISFNDSRYQQDFMYIQLLGYEKMGDYEKAYSLSQNYITMYPDDENGIKLNEFLETRVNVNTNVINDIYNLNSGNITEVEVITDNTNDTDADTSDNVSTDVGTNNSVNTDAGNINDSEVEIDNSQ